MAVDLRSTRRGFLGATSCVLAGVVSARARASSFAPLLTAARSRRAAAAPRGVEPRGFVSRPDLRPPAVAVAVPARAASAGHLFICPFQITGKAESGYGALIVDDDGEPVWFKSEPKLTAMDLRVQHYRGRPVLTWYEGDVLGGYGGQYVIADASYREIGRVRAGRGRHGDLHEFLITSRGTALITIYALVPADLSAVGGPVAGQLTEGVVQEIDIASGRVLFEWRSSMHVGLDESYLPSVKGDVADYFHLNSVGVLDDGHLLISSRHTSTIYKVDRKTGAIHWRLGGKRSDFAIIPGAEFSFQHDARGHADGTITLFNNNAARPPAAGAAAASSRPMRLALDLHARTARLVAEFRAPDARLGWAMGNLQQLPDGGALVGWGTAGSFTEFAPDGRVRFDATLADGSVTYRAFRFPWTGRPAEPPALEVTRDAKGAATAHVSWNGATEVAHWRVHAGADWRDLPVVRTARRSGFETAIPLGRLRGVVYVTALDASGVELGTSRLKRV